MMLGCQWSACGVGPLRPIIVGWKVHTTRVLKLN